RCSRLPTASHTLIVPSPLPVANCLPSGDQATGLTTPGDQGRELTGLIRPLRVSCSRPLAASHTFAVPWPLPVASRVPSGAQATEPPGLVGPSRVSRSGPPAASHTRIVLSQLPVASRAPSGDQDTEWTPLA